MKINKNSQTFLKLSLASDLQNIAQGLCNASDSQISVFVHHAQTLIPKINKIDKKLDELLHKQITFHNDIERYKCADKYLTWSAILQTSKSI